MELKVVNIQNFKSIKEVEFQIEPVDNSYTYTLIGINESGKSSFLKAVNLMNQESISYPYDYFDESKPVVVSYDYELLEGEIKQLK